MDISIIETLKLKQKMIPLNYLILFRNGIEKQTLTRKVQEFMEFYTINLYGIIEMTFKKTIKPLAEKHFFQP
jgi:hypothetical protein